MSEEARPRRSCYQLTLQRGSIRRSVLVDVEREWLDAASIEAHEVTDHLKSYVEDWWRIRVGSVQLGEIVDIKCVADK